MLIINLNNRMAAIELAVAEIFVLATGVIGVIYGIINVVQVRHRSLMRVGQISHT